MIYKSKIHKYRVIKYTYPSGEVMHKVESRRRRFLSFFLSSWIPTFIHGTTFQDVAVKLSIRLVEDNNEFYENEKIKRAKKEIL